MKDIYKNIILLTITVLLFLIVAEISLRIIYFFDRENLDIWGRKEEITNGQNFALKDLLELSNNNRMIYELRENINGYFNGRSFETNSHGLRDYEYNFEKPNNTFRIIGLGDSHMFGWSVNMEDGYLKILEEMLNNNSNNLKYEVINFAVPGYNTIMEVETFKEKALKYNPDLVLINFIDNDMTLPNFIKDKGNALKFNRSFLLIFVKKAFFNIENDILPKLVEAPVSSSVEYVYEIEKSRVPERYKDLVGWDVVEDSLKELKNIADKEEIKVMLVLDYGEFNIPSDKYKPEENYKLLNGEIRILAINEDIGFYVIDPFDRLYSYIKENNLNSKDLWVSDTDPHPNEIRHILLAQEIYLALEKNNPIPK